MMMNGEQGGKGERKEEKSLFFSPSLASSPFFIALFFFKSFFPSLSFLFFPRFFHFSEALAVHDRRAGLVVLALGDPHLLEGGQRSQDGTPDPDAVLALRRRDDLHLHRPGRARGDLLVHAVCDPGEHRRASGQHDVAVQVLADVDVALHDRVEGRLVDAGRLHADGRGREQHLGAAEALGADGDDLAVGQLVGLLDGRGVGRGGELGLVVDGDVGEFLLREGFFWGGGSWRKKREGNFLSFGVFFSTTTTKRKEKRKERRKQKREKKTSLPHLDVAHDLALGRGRERVAALRQDLHHVV
jgi:hypothetical protein